MTIKMPHVVQLGNDKAAAAFIAGKPKPDQPGRAIVNMRFDPALLARIDVAAKAQGISRTAWLHVAASKALDR